MSGGDAVAIIALLGENGLAAEASSWLRSIVLGWLLNWRRITHYTAFLEKLAGEA